MPHIYAFKYSFRPFIMNFIAKDLVRLQKICNFAPAKYK